MDPVAANNCYLYLKLAKFMADIIICINLEPFTRTWKMGIISCDVYNIVVRYHDAGMCVSCLCGNGMNKNGRWVGGREGDRVAVL